MPTIEIIPDFQHLIIQMISLIFLFFMFKRYGWQPTKAFLDKRQEFVANQFKEAEDRKEEAIALKQQYDAKMMNANADAQQLIEHSKAQGKVAYDDILLEAQQASEQKLAKAAVAIEQDKKIAREIIKEEIIEIAMSGVLQMINKEVDAEVHQQLFDDFLVKVGGSNDAK